jgi:hypothetical protein
MPCAYACPVERRRETFTLASTPNGCTSSSDLVSPGARLTIAIVVLPWGTSWDPNLRSGSLLRGVNRKTVAINKRVLECGSFEEHSNERTHPKTKWPVAPHRWVVSDPNSVPGDSGPGVGRCVRPASLPWRQDLRTRLIFSSYASQLRISAPDHSGLKAAAFATVRCHCLRRARSTTAQGWTTLASRRDRTVRMTVVGQSRHLTARRSHPVFPYQRTLSESVGMSQTCQ